MNQILNKDFDKSNSYNNYDYIFKDKLKNKFIIIFFFSIFLIIITLLIFFIIKYNSLKKENISKDLIKDFNIQTLYSNTNGDYISSQITSNINDDLFVIGLIQIDSISIIYPILSNVTDEGLKISPCRFYGPMPNNIGNLCIAGHNYADNKHFGKLNLLDIDDIVKIYDLNGNMIEYKIYEITQISADDLSCTNQNTNNTREITLITCNNLKGNRICIKAKEI